MIYMDERIRILAGSYRSVDDGVRIELFCKDEEGRSVTLLYDGFRPYFHLIDPPKKLIEYLENEDDIKNIEDIELWFEDEVRTAKKVICTYPWRVPDHRKKCSGSCKVLAADIPFVQRFIFDLDLSSTVKVEGISVDDETYTTDRVIKVESFENTDPLNIDLTYLSFDIENSLDDEHIYVISSVVDKPDGKRVRKNFLGEEKNILNEFVEHVKNQDPDVITGYNIDGYDLPLLDERAKTLGFEGLPLSRDGNHLKSRGGRSWKVNGRIIADAWWAVRRELNLKRERLNDAADEVLGEEKIDVDPLKIDKEWEEDKEKVIDYCSRDAELALDILLELGSLDKAMDMATVSHLPVDEALNGRTSTLVDSILIREADKNGVGVPMTKRGGRRGKIKGGYVHSIEAGLYNWVSVLDFKSMYPSIIIENNICFTTISSEGKIKSPTGDSFLSPEQKEGLLPRILSQLMEERDEVKRKMKDSSGKDVEYLDGLQSAIKVLMNSFYGVFASSFYRFTDPRIGESITAFARENIKTVIDSLGSKSLKVIYSDTDSVFFRSPHEDLESTIEISKEIANEHTEGDIVLEFEKVLNPLFSHGRKKRYVAKVVWPEKGMLVRGYEIRRSDSFEAQNEALEAVFECILNEDLEGAVETAKDRIDRVKHGQIDHEKLIISRSCKKFSSYVNPSSMPNVQAAKKMKNHGYRFIPGMKVSWIVTDAKKSPQEVEPWISDQDFTKEPDWDYYARRIAKTLARVTEVFGWDEKGLLSGNKQTSLFSDKFDEEVEILERGSGERKADDEKSDKKKRKMNLKDFM